MGESVTETPQPSTNMEIPAAIAKALVTLQSEVRGLAKTGENDHFKNKYAPLDEVMDAALPLLSKNKLSLMQWPMTIGLDHYLHTILTHETGVSMQSDVKLLLVKQDPQGLGSAITYTRRQTVMAILGLSAKDEDDDGNKASNHLPPPTQEHLDAIADICRLLKFPAEDVDKKLRGMRTDDQAIIALNDLDRIVAGRATAVKARQATDNAAKIDISTPEPEDSLKVATRRLKALNLKDDATISKIIRANTGKPFLKNCKPADLDKLFAALDRLESGEDKLPADYYGPSTEPQIVDEPIA